MGDSLSLFDAPGVPEVHRSAVISTCGRYRYRLDRAWDSSLPVATFVMLNPSTADGQVDDATIRRLAGTNGFARRWGCGAVVVVNLYAWRATDPRELATAADPVGPDNDAFLIAAAKSAAASGGPLVAAWGANATPDRIAHVVALPGMQNLSALALTKSGQPRHPLYLRDGLTPQPWRNPA